MKHRLNLTPAKVRELCITHDFCTGMDDAQYSYLLDTVRRWNDGTGIGAQRLAYIAHDIKLASDTKLSTEEIAALLKYAGKIDTAEAAEPTKKVNLRCTSLQARVNVRRYIGTHFDPSGYGLPEYLSFPDMAKTIWNVFNSEKPVKYNPGQSDYQRFREWCSGLPSILDTCYYYNRSAVADVASILQQTPEKSAPYTETAAEEFLTQLIYHEIIKVVKG